MADPQNTIELPIQTISPGDLIDRALDKLRVAHLALAPENETSRDDKSLSAIWATIGEVIRELEPVRNRLQGMESEASGSVQSAAPN